MTTVAVMQPTFLPWMGYFALMHQVQDFVFLDNVQFSKRSWQCRNRIKGDNGPLMISMPIDKFNSRKLISEVQLANIEFEKKLLKSVTLALNKAPFFATVRELLERNLQEANGSLCTLNTSIIVDLAKLIGIKCRFHYASDLDVKSDNKADRLLEICSIFRANRYLSPIGSSGYLSEYNPFPASKVTLEFINFEHPVYEQRFPPFSPYMSIIDAISNIGPQATLTLMNEHVRPSLSLQDMQDTQNANL